MVGRPLTEKQQNVYDFLIAYCDENHLPPTFREVARHFNLSESSVRCYYTALRKKGWVRVLPHVARGVIPLVPAKKE